MFVLLNIRIIEIDIRNTNFERETIKIEIKYEELLLSMPFGYFKSEWIEISIAVFMKVKFKN